MSSLDFQKFSTIQSEVMDPPETIAAAATITPRAKHTFLTGTTQVENITPPVNAYVEITLTFTNAAPGLFLTTGNILTAYQPIQNRPIDLVWNPATGKWYVKAVV